MDNNCSCSRYPYTDLDLAVTNRTFILLKACLPMLPPSSRSLLASYIKFCEFQATLNLKNWKTNKCKASFSQGNMDLDSLINLIGDYLDKDQLNSIKEFHDMMEMIELMNEMNDL